MNVLVNFQRMMNNIFRESFNNFIIMYLIFSNGLEEHEKMYIVSSINFSEWGKCIFYHKVKFFGYIIFNDRFSMDPKKNSNHW